MARRLSYDFVKEQFENEGYELLSKEYVNDITKLEYVCPDNHAGSITYNNWRAGHRCFACARSACGAIKKLRIGIVKDAFELEDYRLLTSSYKGSSQKLKYVCPKGHRHAISWDSWKQGRRCKFCSIEINASKLRTSYAAIKSSFEKEGYKLLTCNYKNNNQKLCFVCDKGHVGHITWSGWGCGYRCFKCSMGIPDIKDIQKEFAASGYVLTSSRYINSTEKLQYTCPNKHSHSILLSNWRKGGRCPTCARINNSGPNNPSWKGGISCDPYCDAWADKEYKESIKERDNYTCLNPDCRKISDRLVIHHIDYNKKNCVPSNLITVCNSCNSRANHNRDWHRGFYQQIMYEKYNYDYLVAKDLNG